MFFPFVFVCIGSAEDTKVHVFISGYRMSPIRSVHVCLGHANIGTFFCRMFILCRVRSNAPVGIQRTDAALCCFAHQLQVKHVHIFFSVGRRCLKRGCCCPAPSVRRRPLLLQAVLHLKVSEIFILSLGFFNLYHQRRQLQTFPQKNTTANFT
jgi:hypothetical protein